MAPSLHWHGTNTNHPSPTQRRWYDHVVAPIRLVRVREPVHVNESGALASVVPRDDLSLGVSLCGSDRSSGVCTSTERGRGHPTSRGHLTSRWLQVACLMLVPHGPWPDVARPPLGAVGGSTGRTAPQTVRSTLSQWTRIRAASPHTSRTSASKVSASSSVIVMR